MSLSNPSPLVIRLLLFIVRFLAWSYRFEYRFLEHRETARTHHTGGSFALALWHEHLLAGILAHRHEPMAPLASLSRDGDVVTEVMDQFHFQTVRGSSSRGGEQARDELIQIINQGCHPALTIDGPRGPRRRVKGGIIDVARRGGIAILPMIAKAQHKIVFFRSWDHFQLPLPFSKIIIYYGKPQTIAPSVKGLAFGKAKQELKAELDRLEAQP